MLRERSAFYKRVLGAMAGPALGVNVQAAIGKGIGKGPLRPERDAEDPPELLRIFADPDFADLDTAGA